MAVLIGQNQAHGEKGSLDGKVETLSSLSDGRKHLGRQFSLLLLGMGRLPEVGDVGRSQSGENRKSGERRQRRKVGNVQTHGEEGGLNGEVQTLDVLGNLGIGSSGGLAQLLVDGSVSGRQVVLGLGAGSSDNLGGGGPVQSDQLCGSQAGERKSSEFH